jgi:putative ABC transport system permease protein
MLKDYFNISFQGLKQRKLRSWLTMIGIFIGIATIVALISLGQGLQEVVFAQFAFLQADVISVETNAPPGGVASSPLTDKDLRAVEQTTGVGLVATENSGPTRYEYKDQTGSVWIVTNPPGKYGEAFDAMYNVEVEFGKDLEDTDKDKIILGYNIANNRRFKKPVEIGDSITIKGKKFEVKGIMKKEGSIFLDQSAVMLAETYLDLFDLPKDEYFAFSVKAKEGYTISEVVENLEKRLRKVRDVKEEDQDFSVSTVEDQLEQMEASLFAVQLFLYIIAGISIVVGGIGITNTMFTSVLERTNEIGIMKAIGARNNSIFTLFFIEAGLLGTVGGGVGIILGVGFGLLAEFIGKTFLNTKLIQAYFTPELIIGALIFSFIIGAISGILPAMNAAKLHPVDALRKSS